MRTYTWNITMNYMYDLGELCGCGTSGGEFKSLTDAVIEAAENHTGGPGVPEWDGRGPKTVAISWIDEKGKQHAEIFSHYGDWSNEITDRCLEFFNGVDSCDDWRV